MAWNRRQLLAALGAAACAPGGDGGGEGPAPRPLGPTRNLVVVQAYGGWDTLYSIDPKGGSRWMSVPVGQERVYGNLPVWVHSTRPETVSFFEAHHERVAIVHGVNVRSIDHAQCLRWLLTGTRDPLAPDVCAIAAASLGADYPIPLLLLADRAFLGPYAALAARAGGVNQVAALVDPGETYAPVDGTVPLEPTPDEAAAMEAFRASRRARPVGALGGFVHARTDTAASRERASVLRGLGASLGAAGTAQDLANQISMAMDVLEDGLTRVVMLDTQEFFDTHGDNSVQERSQEATFARLSQLFDELEARPGREGGSLFDETVVAVVSEMGRAPTINAAGGKDHWPYASVLLAGAGLKGDVVLGGTSDDAFLGRKVDLETGALDDDGEEIYAERFAAGLLESIGIDPAPWLPGVTPLRGHLA